jgi:hypothetical protein
MTRQGTANYLWRTAPVNFDDPGVAIQRVFRLHLERRFIAYPGQNSLPRVAQR